MSGTINDGGPAFPSTIQYLPDDKNALKAREVKP
jgi:hypothetical protein